MRVLLDHNLLHRLRLLIEGEVETVWHRRWERLRNGDLLNAAEQADFDVVVTIDRGIRHQQNLTGRNIAIIQVRAPTNRFEDLLPLVDALNHALQNAEVSTSTAVSR